MFIVSIIITFQYITFKLNCSLFYQTAGTLVLQSLTIPSNISKSPSISASSITIIPSSSSPSLSVLPSIPVDSCILTSHRRMDLQSLLLSRVLIHSLSLQISPSPNHLSLFSLWWCDIHHADTNTLQPSAQLSLVE